MTTDTVTKLAARITTHINHCFGFCGIILAGFGLYIAFSNWDDIFRGFFLDKGIIISLFGVLLFAISWLGNTAIENQLEIFYRQFLTPQKLIGFYQILLILLIILEVILCWRLLVFNNNFLNTLEALEDGDAPNYSVAEYDVAGRFNMFYAASANRCFLQDQWFWELVNSKCPNTIDQKTCQKCESYSVTTCLADALQCSIDGVMSGACAYNICRYEFLDFVLKDFSRPFIIFIFGVVCLEFICLLLSLQVYRYGCCSDRRSRQVIPLQENHQHDIPSNLAAQNSSSMLSSPEAATQTAENTSTVHIEHRETSGNMIKPSSTTTSRTTTSIAISTVSVANRSTIRKQMNSTIVSDGGPRGLSHSNGKVACEDDQLAVARVFEEHHLKLNVSGNSEDVIF